MKVSEVRRWCDEITAERVITGKYQKLAIIRFLRDLDEKKYIFSEKAAQRALDFCQFNTHFKGEWVNKPYEPEKWQAFCLINIFGFLKDDGFRRYRTSWEEVGRKNGKTTGAAVINNYFFIADGEAGAEVYAAATKKEQAKEVWDASAQMIKRSPDLSKIVSIYRNSLTIDSLACRYLPLSSDTNTLDGLNVHAACLDEVHAYKDSSLYDVIDTATGARRESHIHMTTTAGFMINGFGHRMHEYACKILDGIVAKDDFFIFIAALDDEDDPFDEECWCKPNPNLGVSKFIGDMRSKAEKAKDFPTYYNTFLVKELNKWTNSVSKWLSIDAWKDCGRKVDWSGFRGCKCWCGLDLASVIDMTALSLVFERDGLLFVKCIFFSPQETIMERTKKDRVPYDVWEREGLLITTAGGMIDFDFVEHSIKEITDMYDVQCIAYDRYKSYQIIQNLSDIGINMLQFGQGFKSMAQPTEELEGRIKAKKIVHDNNPILSWNMSNVVIKIDPSGSKKPDKERSAERIDGTVATVMAIGAYNIVRAAPSFIYNNVGMYSG